MKIQFASDFHLEDADNCTFLKEHPIEVAGDVLVLAGDIFVQGQESPFFQDFLDWCSCNFKLTFIVPGNHEFYGGADIGATMQGWEKPLRENVKCMNNQSAVVGDVEFFFTTLWAHVPAEAEEMVNKYMQECKSALYNGAPFTAAEYKQAHAQCRNWLDSALARSQAPRKGVVTHHCPIVAEDPRYESNGLSTAFVNPMEEYVAESGVDAWIFGHTHYNGANSQRCGKTLMATNQLGYAAKGACKGYSNAAYLEI